MSKIKFKLTSAILVLCVSGLTSAQLIQPYNVPTAILQTTSAVLQSFKKDNIPVDSILGICDFSGSSCNGAKIILSRGNKQIFNATLTSRGEFHIPNLKRNESYEFILSWPKHKLVEKRIVQLEEFIKIKVL